MDRLRLSKIISINPLVKADNELDSISRRLSFTAINPTNAEEERHKFFRNTSYEPQFRYAKYRENLAGLAQEVKDVRTDKSTVGKILGEIKSVYLTHISLLKSRGDADKFTKYSKKLYGVPDAELLKEAKKLLKLKTTAEKKVYSTHEVLNRFRFAFLMYGFPWTVEEKEMVANAAVKTNKREILIKKDAKFSKDFVKRLIVHEIGTHVMRKENGAMQPYKFFQRGLPGYLMTEEGLAVINEEVNKCLNNQILKVYAGRVLAVDKALTSSFSETYAMLRKHFSKKTAWRLALRAKRGLGDTSKPGACTKDINYLKGYIEIKKYIKDGGDMNKLYYGKIGLQHVDQLEKIHGLINPKFLPMFRHTNYLVQHFSSFLKSIIFFDLEPSIRYVNRKLRWM